MKRAVGFDVTRRTLAIDSDAPSRAKRTPRGSGLCFRSDRCGSQEFRCAEGYLRKKSVTCCNAQLLCACHFTSGCADAISHCGGRPKGWDGLASHVAGAALQREPGRQ
jgi:hypothetical protein